MINTRPYFVFAPLALAAYFLVGLASVNTPFSAVHAQDDELLPPDLAFAFEARPTRTGLSAKWTIADGYYMYRDKLSFALADSKGEPIEIEYSYPKSKTKEDPAFGNVEVYLQQADFEIPVVSDSRQLVLTVKGQGCNEPIGVCYPPIKKEIPINLIAATVEAANPLAEMMAEPSADFAPQMNLTSDQTTAGKSLSSIDELRNLLGAETSEDELLPPDEAFNVTAITDRDGVNVRFEIADGYYLYQNKIKFSSDSHPLAPPSLPAGELKQDEYFGEVTVYKHTFDALIKLAKASGDETLSLNAQYQGCAELGVCYPPQNKNFKLSIPNLIQSAIAQSTSTDTLAAQIAGSQTSQSLVEKTREVENKTLFWVLLTAFVAGIGLTFTPCVLPLIPILSSVIAGQGEDITKAKAGWLAGVYVLGTAVTYAAIGAVAGATGDQLQAYFQNVWAIGTLALIFFIMSLSMFGLFEIQMPSFIQSRMATKSQGIKGGSIPMVFVLGIFSALIVGACVSPILISFLGIAIAKGSASLGALIMFAMAMGMGIPLIMLGMGAGHLLPKAGMWMDKVKYVFGVMLVGVAIYLLSVLPAVPVLYLWAALFIIVAIYLGATQSLGETAGGWQKLFKGVGTLLLIWGVLALVGAIYGQRDILKPLPERLFSNAPAGQNSGRVSEHVFTRVDSVQALDEKLALARASNKKVIIDYYADWCLDCLKMEETTFKDAAVRAELAANFVALQVDVTDPKDDKRKTLKKRYGVFGPPAVLFFNATGEQLKDKNFYGYMRADKFLEHLRSI